MSCKSEVKVVKVKNKRQFKFFTDEICSKIMLTADSRQQTIYETVKVKPSGTIKISNASDFIMEVMIKHDKRDMECICVKPKSDKIITSTCIDSIKVRCCWLGENDVCSGCLTLILHYPSKYPVRSDCCRSKYDEELDEQLL